MNAIHQIITSAQNGASTESIIDQLQDLQSKLNLLDVYHRKFLTNYYTSVETSDQSSWFDSALSAKSLQYQLKTIGILPDIDSEICEEVIESHFMG